MTRSLVRVMQFLFFILGQRMGSHIEDTFGMSNQSEKASLGLPQIGKMFSRCSQLRNPQDYNLYVAHLVAAYVAHTLGSSIRRK